MILIEMPGASEVRHHAGPAKALQGTPGGRYSGYAVVGTLGAPHAAPPPGPLFSPSLGSPRRKREQMTSPCAPRCLGIREME